MSKTWLSAISRTAEENHLTWLLLTEIRTRRVFSISLSIRRSSISWALASRARHVELEVGAMKSIDCKCLCKRYFRPTNGQWKPFRTPSISATSWFAKELFGVSRYILNRTYRPDPRLEDLHGFPSCGTSKWLTRRTTSNSSRQEVIVFLYLRAWLLPPRINPVTPEVLHHYLL